MNHVPDTELFSAYLDGELTAAEQVRVEQMLATSPEARQMLEELRAVGSSVQGLPLAKLDEDLAARVLEIAERRMLLPALPLEDGAGNKPSAGRAAEALSPSDEIFWRGMFSRRALIWSGVVVATAIIIFFTSPAPQKNPNAQQARLEERAKLEQPAKPGDKAKSGSDELAEHREQIADHLEGPAKDREKFEKDLEGLDARKVADGKKLGRELKAQPSGDVLPEHAAKRPAESVLSANENGHAPSKSAIHGDGDIADDTSRKAADGSVASDEKAGKFKEEARSVRRIEERSEAKPDASSPQEETKSFAKKESDSPARLMGKPGANEVAKDAVRDGDEAERADLERSRDTGKSEHSVVEIVKASPAPAAGMMPTAPVPAAPAPAAPGSPVAAALDKSPPMSNPALSLSGTAPMSVAMSPAPLAPKAAESLTVTASGMLNAITMNDTILGKGAPQDAGAANNTVDRNTVGNNSAGKAGEIAANNGASQFGGMGGSGGANGAVNLKGGQGFNGGQAVNGGLAFNSKQGPANRFGNQMPTATTIVCLDISAPAVRNKVFEDLLAHNGLLIEQNTADREGYYSEGNFNARLAQQDQRKRGGVQDHYKTENGTADNSGRQYRQSELPPSNSASLGGLGQQPVVGRATPPAEQYRVDNGKLAVGGGPVPSALAPAAPPPAAATPAGPAAPPPEVAKPAVVTSAAAAPAAKADFDGQQKIVSKAADVQAEYDKAPQAQVKEKQTQEAKTLQTRNAQTLRATNSQPLVFECDASPDQLVSVLTQIRAKPELFSPPTVQADGLNSAEVIASARNNTYNANAYDATTIVVNSSGANLVGVNTYSGSTNLGTASANYFTNNTYNNTYSGSASINAGTLILGGNTYSGATNLSTTGANYGINNTYGNTYSGPVNISAGTLNILAGQTQQAGSMNLIGAIAGSGASQTQQVAREKPSGGDHDDLPRETQQAGSATVGGGKLDNRPSQALQAGAGGGVGGGGGGGDRNTLREERAQSQPQYAPSGEGRGQQGHEVVAQPQAPSAPNSGIPTYQRAAGGPRQRVVFVLNVVDRVIPAAVSNPADSSASKTPAAPNTTPAAAK